MFNMCERINITFGNVDTVFEKIINTWSPSVLSSNPWIVRLDKVFPEESGHLFRSILEPSLRPSQVGGTNGVARNEDARNNDATPCELECSERAHDFEKTIENATGLDMNYFEWFQLLRYRAGQRYRVHHDSVAYPENSPSGSRVISAIAYLHSPVRGGGTYFPSLKLGTRVIKGSVLMWSNVQRNSTRIDMRSVHEALEVEEGSKYSVSMFVHEFPWRDLFRRDCFKTKDGLQVY